MEDARNFTSSQRLASTFDTLIEIPEAEITAIPVVRPESFPTSNNMNIPVSIQDLVYGGKASGVGTSAKCLDRHNELISSNGEEVGPRKGQQPSGSSPSLHKQKYASKSAKQGQENLKEKSEGKRKAQVEKALPTELQNSQERDKIHGQCVQYGKNSDGIQKQGGGKNEPILSKEIDLVKLGNHFETFNKESLAKLKNSEYIQQKLGRDILQVKDSQKIIIGLESVNKDNILSLTQICARIESKVTLLNQQDENSISSITKN
ncbi:hypothetical protein O181_047147 [Austropuccinia psidii MF-1]|uniref:Uncharacterized protein n=1 Tax=Austropuccinia psidii MF-1 TaxID=1389203 RepID=A0A9Q3HKC6_9BASI|nr:hypothetical protein [Austropuccinia psidii MF-1]